MTNQHETTSIARRFRPRALLKVGVLCALAVVLTTLLLDNSTERASAQTNFDGQILDMINDHRASIGRTPFVYSPSISSGAMSWSQTMHNRNRLGHDPNLPNGLGENVGYAAGVGVHGVSWSTSAGALPSYCRSQMDYESPEMIVCGWLSSGPHRSAIESSWYKQIGIGSVRGNDSVYGRRTYSTARFSSATPAPVANFTSPGNNARLCSGQAVSWSGPNSGKYRLQLGTSRTNASVMNQATGAKSLRVVPLPEGRTLYATLLYRPNGGSWTTAATRTFSPCANPVGLNTTGTLCSGDEISWSGPSSGRYKVRIGTNYDGTQAMNQGTSRRDVDAAPNLPTDRNLYVSLRHRGSDGVWTLQDTAVYAPCSKPIEIISPNNNARLCDNDLIDWVGRSSGKYRIRIGTSPDGTNVLNKSTYSTKYNVGNIPNTSGTLYVSLRHQTVEGGRWALHYTMQLRSC